MDSNKKQMLKTLLNFTFETAIPTLLSLGEKQLPKIIEKCENSDKITSEKLDRLYDGSDIIYNTLDVIRTGSDYLNDKVNNSNFFND